MAKNRIAYYTQAGKTQTTTVSSAVAPGTTIFTAGTNGSKVLAMWAVTGNASSTSFGVYVNDGSTNHLIYSNIGAVADGEDILDGTKFPKASNGLRYINLESGCTLKVIGDGTHGVIVSVYGEDY